MVIDKNKIIRNIPFMSPMAIFNIVSDRIISLQEIMASDLSDDIKQNICKVIEENDLKFWMKVKWRDNKYIEYFLECCPHSTYKLQAEETISNNTKANLDLSFYRSCNDDVECLQKYVEKFPMGKYIREAKKRIQKLIKRKQEDDDLWSEAIFTNTIEAYSRYLSNFPNGIHIDELKEFATIGLEKNIIPEGIAFASPPPAYINVIKKVKKIFNYPSKIDSDKICSCVYAPSQAVLGEEILIQIYLYHNSEQNLVISDAIVSDEDAVKRAYTPLNFQLNIGDQVDIKMKIPNINCEELHKPIIWQGKFTKRSIRTTIPMDYKNSRIWGEITISVNNVELGEMTFFTKVVDKKDVCDTAPILSKMYNKIFLSYSHDDISIVQHYAQALKEQGVEYFFDRHNLGSGAVFEEEIFRFIDSADKFILFWSQNAQKSEFVRKEYQYACKYAYPQASKEKATIAFRPLVIEPYAMPPDDIISIYNFERI